MQHPPALDTLSEPLLRLLFEQSPGFVALLQGPEHVFTLVNPAYSRLIGDRDVLGKRVRDAVPESVPQGFVEILDEVLRSGRAHVGARTPIALGRGPAGGLEQRVLDFVYQPIFAADGRAVAIFVQGHDVTDEVASEARARAEAAHREAQQRTFLTVLSSIEDFAYTFDTDGRFVYANPPLVALLGLTLDQVIGKRFADLPYPPSLAATLDAEIAAVLRTGQRVRAQTFYASPTGVVGWYEYIFAPVLGPDGAVAMVAGSTRDITQHREHERRLSELNEAERAARAAAERAGRMKDDFLATLSHELRTPVGAVLGWGQMLASGRVPAGQIAEAGERITRSARAQARLIADLLDMNGIVSGKLTLAIARTPLARPLLGAVEAVHAEAARRQVTIDVPEAATLPRLDADADRLQQVFWNLLVNAIKFSPPGSTIDIAVAADVERVAVTVTDHGSGVPADFMPHLFERFTQADSSPSRAHGGLGLGLSICKSLVEMHGGRIGATSDGAGRGASFHVTLPRRQAAAGDGDTAAPAAGAAIGAVGAAGAPAPADSDLGVLRGARLLVVDDDADGREMMLATLRQLGLEVEGAGDADEVLERLGGAPFDIVLCDIGLPGTDGYALLPRIRHVSVAPVVALTAFARPEDRRRALAAGFAAHLAKPVELGEVVAVCAGLLRR